MKKLLICGESTGSLKKNNNDECREVRVCEEDEMKILIKILLFFKTHSCRREISSWGKNEVKVSYSK